MAQAPAGLFAELNKGADITKGLQHIDRHELKKEQAPSASPAPSAPASASPSKPVVPAKPHIAAKPTPSSVVKAVPKLVGDKWELEGRQNVDEPVKITIEAMKQSVNVFRCQKAALLIEGKLNSIILNDCKKFNVQVDSVIGGIELVNVKGVHLYITGKVATITVDKCEDVQVHLSEATLKELNGGKDLKLVTCKSGSVNVEVMQENGEEKEMAVPCQFVSYIENGKLVTQPAESIGV